MRLRDRPIPPAPVSIKEPSQPDWNDKLGCRCEPLVGFEGNSLPAHVNLRPMTRLLRFFRPSHQHTAFSATLLLMSAVMLSRVIGYAREAYIAFAFGAGSQTDAYVAAFTLPDFLNYIVAGGAASITFISIYTRFLAEKRDADAQKTFSIIITVMTAVLIVGTIVTEIFAPQFVRWFVKGFKPDQIE